MKCSHPSCREEARYRAPASRERLNDYLWFCLDHVREYNQAWNYYAGMNEVEIERHLREDIVGRRPTWPLGKWGAGGPPFAKGREKGKAHFRFRPDFFPEDIAETLAGDSFSHQSEVKNRARSETGRHSSATDQRLSREVAALMILELKPPVTLQEVKERYKALAKMLHPDANGQNREAEEKLKAVNQAYSTLKAAARG